MDYQDGQRTVGDFLGRETPIVDSNVGGWVVAVAICPLVHFMFLAGSACRSRSDRVVGLADHLMLVRS